MSSIDRPAHKLKGERTLAIPRHFIFFDTETEQVFNEDDTITQRLKLGWACYYRRSYGRHLESTEWYPFESSDIFWQFAFSKVLPKQKLWLIARNVVFDFTVLNGWTYLRQAGYKLKFFHNTGVCVILSVVQKGRSMVFLDSMNWFTESLAKTGQRIGIPKMSIDFETCTRKELSDYCRNDCLIELENFKLFISFLTSNQISRLCYTKAATAMSAYLLNHYHTDIYIHNNAEAINLERAAYIGGRCESFYLGELNNETYYLVDINSMYPFVMSNNQYPVRYRRILKHPSIETVKALLDKYCLVGRATIRTDRAVYAIKRKRTIFPTGTFTASLCTPELVYAVSHGHLLDIDVLIVYDRAFLFNTYVDTMYALRNRFKAENNEQFHMLCKQLLNSLYGKFGQKGENWEKIGEAPNEPDREETLLSDKPPYFKRLRYLLGEVFQMTTFGEAYDSFPAISAHVTAYGRMYLWDMMNIVGNGHYYYCDTDSLLIDGIGLNHLGPYIDDTKLGYLKVEQQSDSVQLRGLKDYTFGDKTVTKGIRKNAERIADGVYKQDQWSSFKGLLRSGHVDEYKVKHVVKHLSREYTKGTVLDNGMIVPFIMNKENSQ